MTIKEAIIFCTEYLKGTLNDIDRGFLKTAKLALEKQIEEKAINPDDETKGHFQFVHGYLTCKKTGKDIRYPLVSIEDFAYCPRCGQKLRWSNGAKDICTDTNCSSELQV